MGNSPVPQALLSALLILGICTSIIGVNQSLLFVPPVAAQPGVLIEAEMDGDILYERSAEGAIYYVQKGSPQILNFRATTEAGAELSYIGMDTSYVSNPLPNGFEISNSFGVITIYVDPSRIDIPDEQLPAGYGIIFKSTRPSADPSQIISSLAETVFIIEPSGIRSSSSIAFDKPSYSYSPTAGGPLDMIVTVIDPHVDCNNIDPDPALFGPPNAISVGSANPNIINPDPNHPMWIRVSVWFDGENPPDRRAYYLQRDPYGNNAFRGLISPVPSDDVRERIVELGSGSLNVEYDAFENSVDPRTPNELCVMPHNDRQQEVREAQVTVMTSEISFDKLTYSANDALLQTNSGTITVRNEEAIGEIVQARIAPDIAPGSITIDLQREQTGVATFSRVISFTQTEPTSVPANPSDPVLLNVATNPNVPRVVTVTAMYDQGSPDPNQPVVTSVATASVLPVRKLSFDDERASYTANEFAKLMLKDPESNADPEAFETHEVSICSYSYPTAANPSAYQYLFRTDVQLAESGRNSGEFVSSYYIKFTNNTFTNFDYLVRNNLHHPENATLIEELQRNAVLVSEEGETLLYATMGGGCIVPAISSLDQIQSDILRPITTVRTALALATDDIGVGGTDVTASHESPPLYSVSTISCDQYDYGPDSDDDGICDGWETGSSLRIPYPAGGTKYTISNACGPCPSSLIPDIYVEIDYIDNIGNGCTSPYNVSYRPDDLAISNVISAFNNYNVKLHIQVGEDAGGSTCRTSFNVWGDSDAFTNSFDEMKKTYFGFTSPNSERLTEDRGKAKYQEFHYGIFGPRQSSALGSSGVAEPIGNDFVVTLGSSSFQYNNVDQQQGTLMHELGHNLGLHHGGPDDGVNDHTVNCKPNYPSVMSYIRQFTNAYDNATLRYSDDKFQTDDPTNNRRISSQNPSEVDVLKLYASSALNSVELVWGIYVGGVWVAVDNGAIADVSKSWSDIDWNDNGFINSDPPPDPPGDYIIKLGITGCTSGDDGWIYGADDWANLALDFRHINPTTFTSGLGHPESYPQEMNNVTHKEIRLAGITTLNYTISQLSDEDFVTPGNSSTVKADFHDQLLVDSSSVSALISADALDEAIDKLLGLRTYMDGSVGGNTADDLFIHEPPRKSIDFSRVVLPIPPEPGLDTEVIIGSTVFTSLILTDPDESESGSEEGIAFTFEDDALPGEPSFRVEIDGQGTENDAVVSGSADYAGSLLEDILPGLGTLSLGETGGATGIFNEELEFEFGSLDLDEWQGLEVLFTYVDANGTKVDAGITFRGYDGILGAAPDGVTNGDIITITVQDNDLNLDDDTVEVFNSTVGTNGTFLVSVDTEDDHIAGTTAEIFKETNASSGIFTSTFAVGQDIQISGNGTQATNIVMIYNDEVDSNGDVGEERKITIPVVTGSGVVLSRPEQVGPGTEITVFITDTDLDQDSSSTDEYAPIEPDTDDFFVNFQSDRSEVGEASPSIEETGPNTGVFQFNIGLMTDEGACQDNDLSSDPDLKATGGSEPSIGVCPGDLVSIRYEDDQDSNGTTVVVSRVIEVGSWDPEFASDRNTYNVGDTVIISIADPDANRNPDIADSLMGIKVTSDSDLVGEEFTAMETGRATGLFRFAFTTTAGTSSGALTVNDGDDITIEYTDEFPAAFEDENEEKDFTFTVSVGSSVGGDGMSDIPTGGESTQTESLTRVKDALRIMDNNIASLKVAMNLPFEELDPFEITSLDHDCDESDDDNEGCTIVGYSESVTSVSDTFHIDELTESMVWDFVGQGRVELHIPYELTPYVSDVRSVANGMRFTHTTTTDGETTIVVIEDLSYYPRQIDVKYDSYDFPIRVPDHEVEKCLSIAPCVDVDEINPGDNVIVTTLIRNDLDESVPCTVVTEVRNPQGVTIALYWKACTTSPGGAIGPDDTALVSTNLKLDELGEYQITTIIVDDLDRPTAVLGYDRFELPPVV